MHLKKKFVRNHHPLVTESPILPYFALGFTICEVNPTFVICVE